MAPANRNAATYFRAKQQSRELTGSHYRSFYLQALPILSAKLEESHPWRQEASNNWRSFLQKAIQAHRTDELSDDPMTQMMLRQIREGDGVGDYRVVYEFSPTEQTITIDIDRVGHRSQVYDFIQNLAQLSGKMALILIQTGCTPS